MGALRRIFLTRFAMLFVGVVGLAGCAGPPADEHVWVSIRTPRYEVLSDAPADRVAALTETLVRFDRAARAFLELPETSPGWPHRVYLFRDSAAFADFRRRPFEIGYVLPRLTYSYLAVNLEALRSDGLTTLQHEVAHLLLREPGSRRPLPWFDEGLAEVLSTARFEDGALTIGRPPRARVEIIRRGTPLPLEWVLDERGLRDYHGDAAGGFYARSWGLVHLLRLGHHAGQPDRRAALQDLLARQRRGEAAAPAVSAALGIDLDALEGELRSYVAGGSLPRETRRPLPPGQLPAPRTLGPGETAYVLGDLALQLGGDHLESAETLLRRAVTLRPDDARAVVRLAQVRQRRGAPEESAALLDRALALDSGDPLVWLIRGRWRMARLRSPGLHARPIERQQLLREARGHFARAVSLAPTVPATYLGFAGTYLAANGQVAAGLRAAETARRLAPWNGAVALQLAQLQLRAGRNGAARELLHELVAFGDGEPNAATARSILERMASAPPVDRSR